MKQLLIVIDMQNDFVTGVLGTPEAVAIVPAVVARVQTAVAEGQDVIFTRDTHAENYLDTQEGHYLPVPHCIHGTEGWEIIPQLQPYVKVVIDKPTFGSTALVELVAAGAYDEITLIGLCTDICVVSNALLLKASFPEKRYLLDPTCCAGVTPESHRAALTTMQMCHIEIS